MKTTKTTGRTVKNVPMWITEYGNPDYLKPGSKDQSFLGACTPSFTDMKSAGWTRVGTATITVDLIPEKDLVSNKVESLQAQLAADRAESELRHNAILEKISKLQALEYTA